MKVIAVPLIAVLIIGADGFFYSETKPRAPTDCAWLPWEYKSCLRRGTEFVKSEDRKRIPLHGEATCDLTPEHRETESCTAAEHIASTILGTIANRESHHLIVLGESHHQSILINAALSPPRPTKYGRPTEPTTTTTTTTTTTKPNVCRGTFFDPVSGVKMLGADCGSRRRRSLETSERAKSRTKRQFGGNITSTEHRDILFLLDESGSVGETNFKKEMEFVEVLAGKFKYPRQIGEDATHVALTTFASRSTNHIGFLDSNSYGEFMNRVRQVRFQGGSTCLINALRAARTQIFSSTISRVPYAADGLIILITDGCFNCYSGDMKTALKTERDQLVKLGVTIVTFMVNVDETCEGSLAALREGSTCFLGYSYPSWQKFDQLIKFFRTLGPIDQWTKRSEACP